MKRFAGLLIAALWALPLFAYDPLNREEYLAKIAQAKALYKEKCEKVAGIKIYKTVPDVEGLLLMKVRPMRSDRELADPMWPGAAFGREAYADDYITSFLGYEKRPEGSTVRGFITTSQPSDNVAGYRWEYFPGYRWVEVIDPNDGQRYRYTGSEKIVGRKDTTAYNVQLELKKNPNYDLNVYRWSLDKSRAPQTPPRYGVTFEDHVIPKERALWVASSTVRVLDLKTNEVLGEMTRYAISYIHAPRHSMPWLNHYECPVMNATGDSQSTRVFVDEILIPARRK